MPMEQDLSHSIVNQEELNQEEEFKTIKNHFQHHKFKLKGKVINVTNNFLI